jgi:hypothetical protein
MTFHHVASYRIASGKNIESTEVITAEFPGYGRFGRRKTDLFGSGFAFGDGHLLCRPLDLRYYEQKR